MKKEQEHLKCIKICDLLCIKFLKENKAHKEQISISSSSLSFGIFVDEKLVGVIGLLFFKKCTRIKSFYVLKEYRKNGIGTLLLDFVLSLGFNNLSCFATQNSFNIFVKKGFILENTNKNGISFLKLNKINNLPSKV